ncbi:FimV C-terminal domain-containing protein [Pseudomonas asplenii]|uniref:FimV C-terminal domain-containing protein n=2 Tax=Pseudomonas asplenii TaxID=53407 RepID=A0A1H6PD55_9PSED|nr:FimV C-terminal domain-containing protein [Pseudomonas fuscovaginae]
MLESLQSALRCSTEKPQVTPVRRHWMALAALAALHPALASAMGLGDITLHSALSQPLDAQIALVDPGDLADGELSVSLATPEEFAQAGVERLFFLNDLRFTPVLQGNRSFIRVQSNKPVSEPFLNFLVQVNRPNGRLLREYTVLLDPPGSGSYSPSTRAVQAEQPLPSAEVAPPPATQGKRYTVTRGDNLWTIAKRLNEAGSKASVNELSQGIRALNPGSERLTVGQSLLLPDVAVVPGSAPAAVAQAPTASAAPVVEAERSAEQLAAATLENQQLQKTVDDLQARLKSQDEQIASDQKHLGELEAQLAEFKTKAAAPVVSPAPVVPSAAPAPAPVVAEPSEGTNLLLLAALAVLLLSLAAALIVRRRRRLPEVAVEPAPLFQEPPLVSRVIPTVVPSVPAPRVEPVVESRRETSEVPDALEGVSIYIAYGRFSEAAGILREAILKEPQRTDLRLRLMDVLAQQGDNAGYTVEEQHLLDTGFSESTLRDLRAKHPKLHTAPAPTAIAKAVAPVPAPAPIVAPAPAPAPVSTPVAVAGAATLATPVLAAEWMNEESKAETEATPLDDEFQLNLDDLSMDSDWDLVSPFDNALPQRGKAEPEPEPTLSGSDPQFASNLNELPHVFEMPDEQFLSDFADPEPERPVETELSLPLADDTLDDEFLDGFMDDSQPLDIEPLEVDFDSLEREQASASKLEQAQTLINVGDLDHASQLLHELLREGDEPLKQTARTLLASIR